MSAIIVDAANAVVSILSGATLSQSITVDRGYVVVRDFEFTDLRVTVVPPRLAISVMDTTPRLAFDWVVSVVIQKAGIESVSDVDGLMLVLEEIATLFSGKVLPGTRSRCIGTEASPLDPSSLDTHDLFSWVLSFTFRTTK